MKRGEILYPFAFTIAAVLVARDGASMKEIIEGLGTTGKVKGPEKTSLHQMLRQMEKNGYVMRREYPERQWGYRLVWKLTDEGWGIVDQSKEYYQYALELYARGRSSLGQSG
jgi:DNA-binding MarR family transcriptional regulator